MSRIIINRTQTIRCKQKIKKRLKQIKKSERIKYNRICTLWLIEKIWGVYLEKHQIISNTHYLYWPLR
jgi:hypothetical protein